MSSVLGAAELDLVSGIRIRRWQLGKHWDTQAIVAKRTFSVVASVSYFGSALSAIVWFPRVGVRNRLCDVTPLARKFATAQRGLATIRRQFRRFVAGDKCRGSQDWRYDGQLVKALIDCLTVGAYANTRGTHPMTKLTEYLHTAASAEYLGVAQNTLRKWAALGRLPMHRNPANGYRLFKRSDLDKFLKETAKPVNCGI